METLNRYNVCKTNKNCEPIEGSDRIITGVSRRAITKHLAYEEGVEIPANICIVRCKDDNIWHVSHKLFDKINK